MMMVILWIFVASALYCGFQIIGMLLLYGISIIVGTVGLREYVGLIWLLGFPVFFVLSIIGSMYAFRKLVSMTS